RAAVSISSRSPWSSSPPDTCQPAAASCAPSTTNSATVRAPARPATSRAMRSRAGSSRCSPAIAAISASSAAEPPAARLPRPAPAGPSALLRTGDAGFIEPSQAVGDLLHAGHHLLVECADLMAVDVDLGVDPLARADEHHQLGAGLGAA